ncbi:metallophosphoesterase family protein [Thioalkalivibrio sulfidiphilus]|uniref:metallophosphoesterase family protein n=1 Tax=Thioalkalivibrio sulfidiphilus TaxID=1033854 RepID=UPI003B38CCF2
MQRIIFYGDPHGDFSGLIRAAEARRPEAVVILGDLGLAEASLDRVLAPLVEAGIQVAWVHGNHESDSVREHDHAFLCRLGNLNLHGRVMEVGGLRMAGLGGVFRGKVWYPGTEPVFRTRSAHLASFPKRDHWRAGLPLRHRTTIYPEDLDLLASLEADVLVCHEAPGCHPHGFGVIDELARAMGVGLIVHGHQHVDYEDSIGGVRVRGVAEATAVIMDEAMRFEAC